MTTDLDFVERGRGDAILLVHGGVFSDWFAPVAKSPELDGFRVICVRRAGYGQGSAPSGHLTLADHAEHCARLLEELEIDTAHVCGHSSGALVALELALLRPDAVRSLVLLEPAPASALVGPQCQSAVPAALGPVMGAVAGGEIASAFDLFLRAVGRQDYRAILDSALGPDAYERALQESAFFFSDEVPAVQEWSFGPGRGSADRTADARSRGRRDRRCLEDPARVGGSSRRTDPARRDSACSPEPAI